MWCTYVHQNIPSLLILLWGADASINGFHICIWNLKIPNKCVFVIWIFFFDKTKLVWILLYGVLVERCRTTSQRNFFSRTTNQDGEIPGALFIHNRHHNVSISDWKWDEQNRYGSGTGACGVPCRLAAQFQYSGSINKHLWKRGLQTAKSLYLRGLVCLTKKTFAVFMMHNKKLESLPIKSIAC